MSERGREREKEINDMCVARVLTSWRSWSAKKRRDYERERERASWCAGRRIIVHKSGPRDRARDRRIGAVLPRFDSRRALRASSSRARSPLRSERE